MNNARLSWSRQILLCLSTAVFFSVVATPQALAEPIPWCEAEGVDDNGDAYSPRPYWSELGLVPDYQNVSTIFNLSESLTIMISMLEKAMAKVSGFLQPYPDDAVGTCLCNCNQTLDFWVNYLETTLKTNLVNALNTTKDEYILGLKSRLDAVVNELQTTLPDFQTGLQTIVQDTMDQLDADLGGVITDPATAVQDFVQETGDIALAELEAIFQEELAQVLELLSNPLNTGMEQIEGQANALTSNLLGNILSMDMAAISADMDNILAAVGDTITVLADETVGVGETYWEGITNGTLLNDWKDQVMAAVTAHLQSELEMADAAVAAAVATLETDIEAMVQNKLDEIKASIDNLVQFAIDYETVFETFADTLVAGVLSDLTNVEGCYGKTQRSACTIAAGQYCEGTVEGTILGGSLDVPVWFPTNTFKDGKTAVKFALSNLNFLEGVFGFITDLGDGFLSFAGDFMDALENAQQVIDDVSEYVDTFTDGFHLGTYSQIRPDLHMCVGYAGHNTYAELASFDVADHTISAGAGYKSFNIVKKHRVQFRSGGLAVGIDNKFLQLVPGIQLNTQMDGFRMWNKYFPFGLGASAAVDWGIDPQNFEFDTNDVDQVDVFNLVDQATLELLCPGNVGPCDLTPTSFLYEGYFPIDYPDPADLYTWPRGPEWEDELRSSAVFGMGLNIELLTKAFVQELPPGGILLFAPPTVFLSPWLSVQAGASWTYAANEQRNSLQEKLNQNMAPADQLTEDDFARHAIPLTGDILTDGEHFQAPDVTEDVGHGAGAWPKVGADLDVGIKIGKWLKLGITASVFLGLDLDVGVFGGVLDLNRKLVEALADSNPQGDDCHVVIDENLSTQCSNHIHASSIPCEVDKECTEESDCHPSQDCVNGMCTPDCGGSNVAVNNSPGPYSLGTYACSGDAAQCENFGYCVGENGQILAHDVTQAGCEPGPPVDLGQGSCVAVYKEEDWNPCGCGVTTGPETWAALGQGAGGPPIFFPMDILNIGPYLAWEQKNVQLAQHDALVHITKEKCENNGWCLHWTLNSPGLFNLLNAGINTLDGVFTPGYTGTTSVGGTCPDGVFISSYTMDTLANGVVESTTIPAGSIIDYAGTTTSVPAQFHPFKWVCGANDTNQDGTMDDYVVPGPEGCDVLPVENLGGTWFPYQCTTSMSPEVVGWTGPDCNPLEFGYPSACSCWDDASCTGGCGETHICGEAVGESCACDPNQGAACIGNRVCVSGACLAPCTTDADCGYAMVCGGDGGCLMENGVPFAEQVVYEMGHVEAPMHAVASYALNKVIFSAILGAAVEVGISYKLFKKWKKKTVFEWSDVFPLVEFPFVKHQLGMQVDYQNDCAGALSYVQNHQPGFVTRPLGVADGSSAQDLIDWCMPAMAEDVQNPDQPSVEDVLGNGLQDVFDLSEGLGMDFWAVHQLCINGQVWYDYVTNVQLGNEDAWDDIECTYTHNGVTQDIACVDEASLFSGAMMAIGCVDTAGIDALSQSQILLNVLQSNGLLATYTMSYTPMVNGVAVGPTQIVLDPMTFILDFEAEDLLHPSNIDSTILGLSGQIAGGQIFISGLWLATLNACIDDVEDGGRYDDDGFNMIMPLTVEECNPCELPNADPELCADLPVAGACCTPGGECAMVTDMACSLVLDGVWSGGLSCDEAQCQPSTDGCCLPDDVCMNMAASACEAASGTPAFGGCANPYACGGTPKVACCTADGCNDDLPENCEALGGTAYPGLNCNDPGVCVELDKDACCLPSGQCQELIDTTCLAMNGVVQVNGTCQDPGVCGEVFPGACCTGDSCTLALLSECSELGGVFEGGSTCEGACAGVCADEMSGQCKNFNYLSQCDPDGFDCGNGNSIMGDMNCDGQYEVCLICQGDTVPIDTNGDGCEDTCGCCPDLGCTATQIPVNIDADICGEVCAIPGEGLCKAGITGMCGGFDYLGQCGGVNCGTIGIQGDSDCNGLYDVCLVCPDGTFPTDTTGDGCTDSCDCCTSILCPQGQVAFDTDGDSCAETCVDELPILCEAGSTGLCLGFDYSADCNNLCGDIGIQSDSNCDGSYDSCMLCGVGTVPTDTTGDSCNDSCDCSVLCPPIKCPVGTTAMDLDDDGCPDACKKNDKLDCCTSLEGGECLSFGDVTKSGGITDVVDVQCTILITLYQLGGSVGGTPGCMGDATPAEVDLNCDGGISVTDVLLVIKAALSLPMEDALDADGSGCTDTCEYTDACEDVQCEVGKVPTDTTGDGCFDTCQECILPLCPAGSTGVIDTNADGCVDTCLPPCDDILCLIGQPIDTDDDGCDDSCSVCAPMECALGLPIDTSKDGCPDSCTICDAFSCAVGEGLETDTDQDACPDACGPCPAFICEVGFQPSSEVNTQNCFDGCVCSDVLCIVGQIAIDTTSNGCLDTCQSVVADPCEQLICLAGTYAAPAGKNDLCICSACPETADLCPPVVGNQSCKDNCFSDK